MYERNFRQLSTNETWFETFNLVAYDDWTPIHSDEVTVYLQMWARSARGGGDQSQFIGLFPYYYAGNSYNAIPAVSANTDDGTGLITLIDGTLQIVVPLSQQQILIPGYYEVGMSIRGKSSGITQQLCVGLMPVYNGGVWSNGNG